MKITLRENFIFGKNAEKRVRKNTRSNQRRKSHIRYSSSAMDEAEMTRRHLES